MKAHLDLHVPAGGGNAAKDVVKKTQPHIAKSRDDTNRKKLTHKVTLEYLQNYEHIGKRHMKFRVVKIIPLVFKI